VSHYLLKRQCNVVVVARSEMALEDLRSQYENQVKVLAGDLSDMSLGRKAAQLATSTWSRIDGLVVNHGVLDPISRVSSVDVDEWKKSFDINLFSAVAIVRNATRGNADSSFFFPLTG
jgi:NADP-dependent 3-hydroxy acid dehydrogenase YdfG